MLIFLCCHHPQKEIITPQHDIAAFIQHRHITHFHVGLSSINRQHSWFKRCGIPHFCVTITRHKRTGHHMTCSRSFNICVSNGINTMIFWHQHTGDISFPTANMCMQINRARHHDLTFYIIFFVRLSICWSADNSSILNINILLLAVHPIRRIIDNTAC